MAISVAAFSPYAFQRHKFLNRRLQHPVQAAEMSQQAVGQRLDIPPGNGKGQQQLQRLMRREAGQPGGREPFPQPRAVAQVISAGFSNLFLHG